MVDRLPRHWLDGTMPNRVTNQSLFPMLMVCILKSRAPFINIAFVRNPPARTLSATLGNPSI
jgi:hypothetical protein